MSGNRWSSLKAVAVGSMAVIAMTAFGGVAEAAVGDPIASVAIPNAANCAFEGSFFGTAVAVVSGGKLGFPAIPTLLVTSCSSGEGPSTLFFLDPSTNPATMRANVSPSTSLRWDALALRGNTADMLGCNDNGKSTSLFVIHFSPFDPVAAPGNTSFLTTGPIGATCDGVAWDASDKTIYQTSTNFDTTSGSFSVLHYSPSNSSAFTSIPSGCGNFFVGGVGTSGASLFVACSTQAPAQIGANTTFVPDVMSDLETIPAVLQDALPSIRQLDKTNGNLVRTLTTPGIPAFPGGLPDDPGTFGSQFKEALWTKETLSGSAGNLLLAYEIPGGTLGQTASPPLLFPAACDQVTGSTPDADGDGLLDCWEDGSFWSDHLPGISVDGTYSAGRDPASRAVTLCVDMNGNNTFDAGECASPSHKDIFVEINYMQFHKPDPVAMNNVVAAFANAPVSNPDSTNGIRLHLQFKDETTSPPLAHADRTGLTPCTPAAAAADADFDALKAASFGTAAERADATGVKLNARRNAFHNVVFVHNQAGAGNTASGCAEILGNDLMVSLGSFAVVNGHNVGSTDQQGGTFMHELGHNLSLRHGGFENLNCKPNYTSVMNYSYQFSSPLNPRPLDYSRQALMTLNESSLNEALGVGGYTGSVTWGPAAGIVKPSIGTATGAVNWNRNATSNDPAVARDLNSLGISGCPASPGETLVGFNDWANIKLNFRASLDFADGSHATIDTNPDGSQELSVSDVAAISLDTDGDGIPDVAVDANGNYVGDNCPLTFNNDQKDSNNDGIGDACSVGIKILRPSIPSTSQGVVKIAILGSATRDVTKIDSASIAIHGVATQGNGLWSLRARDAGGKCSTSDVNGDGKTDLVCQFKIDARLLPSGVSSVILDAMTFSGEELRGQDSIDVRDVGNGQ